MIMRQAPDRPIAVFDSGIGGLTVVRELMARLPGEDIIYLGDTARLPFGGKSPATIQKYSLQISAYLMQFSPKALVIACNTASAWALQQVAAYCPVPVLGVVKAGCAAAARATRSCRIGVIGTNATIRSGAYPRGIHRLMPEAVVASRSCPMFVPLVEEGWLEHSVTDAVIAEYCTELKEAGVDTLVLGCTHYPMLMKALARFFGPGIPLVSSSEALAEELDWLLTKQQQHAGSGGKGSIRYLLTDHSETMHKVVTLFLGHEEPGIEVVDITNVQPT